MAQGRYGLRQIDVRFWPEADIEAEHFDLAVGVVFSSDGQAHGPLAHGRSTLTPEPRIVIADEYAHKYAADVRGMKDHELAAATAKKWKEREENVPHPH